MVLGLVDARIPVFKSVRRILFDGIEDPVIAKDVELEDLILVSQNQMLVVN